jgi:hypothetical protein
MLRRLRVRRIRWGSGWYPCRSVLAEGCRQWPLRGAPRRRVPAASAPTVPERRAEGGGGQEPYQERKPLEPAMLPRTAPALLAIRDSPTVVVATGDFLMIPRELELPFRDRGLVGVEPTRGRLLRHRPRHLWAGNGSRRDPPVPPPIGSTQTHALITPPTTPRTTARRAASTCGCWCMRARWRCWRTTARLCLLRWCSLSRNAEESPSSPRGARSACVRRGPGRWGALCRWRRAPASSPRRERKRPRAGAWPARGCVGVALGGFEPPTS